MNIYQLTEEDKGTQKPFADNGNIKTTYFKPILLGEKVAKPGDTNGGFGIRKSNGNWATLNPNGDWEERPGSMENLRTWETFYPGNPGTSAPRDGKPHWFKTVEMP